VYRASPGPVDTSSSLHARLRTFPFAGTTITSGFWHEQQQTNREASLWQGYRMLERAGNLDLLSSASLGATRPLDLAVVPPFLDSDVYKWLEAIAYASPEGLRACSRMFGSRPETAGKVKTA
jgi:hypothetical protein